MKASVLERGRTAIRFRPTTEVLDVRINNAKLNWPQCPVRRDLKQVHQIADKY